MQTLSHSFRFCPRCAAPNPEIKEERCLVCLHCDLTFYFNTAAAAGAFILYEDQVILCERARAPKKGLIDIPGGFIEPGETVEEGLRREIYEEIHVDVGPLHYLGSAPNFYPYRDVPYQTADLFFVAPLASLEGLKAQDDVASIKRINPFSFNPADFAFDSTRLGFEYLLRHLVIFEDR